MKKIGVLLILLAATQLCFAQREFKFGAKAGLNLASIGVGDSSVNIAYSPSANFHAGLYFEVPITEKFSFQPEVLYSGQGQGNLEFLFGNSVNLGYINVPLLAKYYIIKGLSVELGPVPGVLVLVSGDDQVNFDGSTVKAKDNYNTFDLGIGVGVTYNFSNRIFTGIRYQKGLTNIFEETYSNNNFKGYNNVLQFSVGYWFW